MTTSPTSSEAATLVFIREHLSTHRITPTVALELLGDILEPGKDSAFQDLEVSFLDELEPVTEAYRDNYAKLVTATEEWVHPVGKSTGRAFRPSDEEFDYYTGKAGGGYYA